MTDTPALAWDAMKKYYDNHKDNSLLGVNFAKNTKDKYVNDFLAMYKSIKDEYMSSATKELDRHKQAAILLHCTIQNELFKPQKILKDDEIFVGCEQIGLLLSLSYMRDMLNKLLKEINEKPIQKYIFPKAFTCETEYFDILIRDLYLQKHKEGAVYVLSLAHILYLIEYNTLREINPDLIDKIKQHMASQK